ncbi:MAG: hypothetical protein IRY83_17025, partial [Chloroflexi bacterium]|nr:hypothetical protein [Chloroflexota bacterium]
MVTGALVVALVAGIFAAARLGPSGKAPVQAEASWAQGYANLSELTKAADLVGVFRVDRVVQVTKDQTGVEYTDFEATPVQHIKGSAAGAIIIHQTGWPDMVVADDPPMK